MEKMIGVINDNLRNVINGIKTHRVEAEKSLSVIISEIDEKVGIAQQYKQSVEDARTVIASLENEISDLERDLADLNDKFGAKNFKEILAAGNKEISTKIIEKRSLISDQSRIISELTEQAHRLKEELLKLKERRTTTEQLLNKSIMLETYYEVRISEIIKFSEENPDSLDEFIDEYTDKSINVEKLSLADIDIDEIVDGSVFEEIDSLSTSNVDETSVKEAIEDIKEDKGIDEDPSKYIDLSVTQQLDDIILAASSIIAKEKEEVEVEEDDDDSEEESAIEIFDEIQNIDELTKEAEETTELDIKIDNLVNDLDDSSEKSDEDSIEEYIIEENILDETESTDVRFPLFDEITEPTEEFKVELREVEDYGDVIETEEITSEPTEEETEEVILEPIDNLDIEYKIDIKDLEDDGEISADIFDTPFEPNEEEKEEVKTTIEEDEDDEEGREYTLDDFLGPQPITETEPEGEELELEITPEMIKEETVELQNDEETEEVEDLTIIDDLLMETAEENLLFPTEPIIPEPNKEEKVEEIEELPEEMPKINEAIVINRTLDVNDIKESLFSASTKDFYTSLEECGLNYDRFSEEDLILLESFFNKQNTLYFIQVLQKHNIAIDIIYQSLNVLMNVTPQNLDKIISLLKVTGATSEAINCIFKKLDRVNINDLERAININSNRQLIEVLYEAIPYTGEEDLVKELKLDQADEMTFRNNTTIDEFKMMNLFPEVVMANYNELKKLNIDNLTECIIKHPRRFAFNPDRFMAILDKYDTEDLIRCINKNCAVIDRL